MQQWLITVETGKSVARIYQLCDGLYRYIVCGVMTICILAEDWQTRSIGRRSKYLEVPQV